ncbi:unnamed protein product [Linum trigynum]|uniref:Reverse transcriptase Ty1/copia-type domain-containing protein n=1 Tax=Linum trigynum TaxID=586398 RepID=A0AAV2FE96_9ROSI
MSSKTSRCVFLGYSDIHKGYLCYDPSADRIRISCHVVFFENVTYYESLSSSSNPPLFSSTRLPVFEDDGEQDEEPPPETPPETPLGSPDSPGSSSSSSSDYSVASPDVTSSSSAESSPPPAAVRRSTRANFGKPPARLGEFYAHSVTPITILTRYSQAKNDPRWQAAMGEEFYALDQNHTWSIVDRPPPPTPMVGCRWLYMVKYHPDGSLERFRARLVAQGFTQEYGIDFEETFAPVAKMPTVRTLLAVAAVRNWPLFQFDIKNAFLHGDLKEVVYMEIPPGHPDSSPGKVCLLHRSLYGLKQAPRAWFEKFQQTILGFGFHQSRNDPSLFTRTNPRGRVVLLIYVDDMIVTGDDLDGISKLKADLHAHFHLKELGHLSYFLGIEVHRSDRGILFSQHKYINDLLDDHRFAYCLPVRTPIELNLKLGKESGTPLVDGRIYRSIVGSLIYLVATRPDIAYAVQVVSQFMAAPRTDHLAAVHRILRYLQGTRDVGLFLPSTGDFHLRAYSDSEYAGCIDTRRSTTGWCIQFGSAFISWRCKKQDKVSKSSTEAEYRAMSDCGSEMEWLSRLLGDLGVAIPTPMVLHVDNTSAIQIAVNPVLHNRTKHIEVHVHYIRDLVGAGTIRMRYIPTEE